MVEILLRHSGPILSDSLSHTTYVETNKLLCNDRQCSHSLIFMQFSAKKLQNNRLAHPLWELAPISGKSLIRR